MQAEQEGPGLVAADEVGRLVGEEVGQIGALFVGGRRVGLEIEVYPHRDDRFVESALLRVVRPILAEVPLAEEGGGVTGGLEGLRERDLLERQPCHVVHRPERSALPVEAIDVADRVHPGPRPVLTAHEGGPGWLAIGPAGVAAGEADALGGEPVDAGTLIVPAAVAGQVGITQIVGQDKDDVGPAARASGTGLVRGRRDGRTHHHRQKTQERNRAHGILHHEDSSISPSSISTWCSC